MYLVRCSAAQHSRRKQPPQRSKHRGGGGARGTTKEWLKYFSLLDVKECDGNVCGFFVVTVAECAGVRERALVSRSKMPGRNAFTLHFFFVRFLQNLFHIYASFLNDFDVKPCIKWPSTSTVLNCSRSVRQHITHKECFASCKQSCSNSEEGVEWRGTKNSFSLLVFFTLLTGSLCAICFCLSVLGFSISLFAVRYSGTSWSEFLVHIYMYMWVCVSFLLFVHCALLLSPSIWIVSLSLFIFLLACLLGFQLSIFRSACWSFSWELFSSQSSTHTHFFGN